MNYIHMYTLYTNTHTHSIYIYIFVLLFFSNWNWLGPTSHMSISSDLLNLGQHAVESLVTAARSGRHGGYTVFFFFMFVI